MRMKKAWHLTVAAGFLRAFAVMGCRRAYNVLAWRRGHQPEDSEGAQGWMLSACPAWTSSRVGRWG